MLMEGTDGARAGDGFLATLITEDTVAVWAGDVCKVLGSEAETILAGGVGTICVAGDVDTCFVGGVGTGRHCWRCCWKTPSG